MSKSSDGKYSGALGYFFPIGHPDQKKVKQYRVRECLRCGQSFKSASKYHRICLKCHDHNRHIREDFAREGA